MQNPAINFLLADATEALHRSNAMLAHRLVCRADRLASKDRTISVARRDAIRAARLATAAATF